MSAPCWFCHKEICLFYHIEVSLVLAIVLKLRPAWFDTSRLTSALRELVFACYNFFFFSLGVYIILSTSYMSTILIMFSPLSLSLLTPPTTLNSLSFDFCFFNHHCYTHTEPRESIDCCFYAHMLRIRRNMIV